MRKNGKTSVAGKFKIILFMLLLALLSTNSFAGEYPIDLQKAGRYFENLKKYCDRDGGQLWGENLWAPILIIDRKTRFVVANQADKEGLLKKERNVYIGRFPADQNIANSTTRFGGKLWTMLMYPLPKKEYNRYQLGIHELYHFWQNKNNLDFSNYNNEHMDKMNARILVKLEWSALEEAILNEKEIRKHIKAALIFRKYRRLLYPEKVAMESEFEIHEGLAEYTGYKICANNERDYVNNIMENKDMYWNSRSYVRSFAYYSGILYGYILDKKTDDWNYNINPESDLGSLALKNYKIKLPHNIKQSYEKLRENYDYAKIYQVEETRKRKQQEKIQEYITKFTQESVLILETKKPKVAFNPRTLIPLDTLGTVYPTIKIISEWGKLYVKKGGCLFNWKRAIVSAKNLEQTGQQIIGQGWHLELEDNWELFQIDSNYKLRKVR